MDDVIQKWGLRKKIIKKININIKVSLLELKFIKSSVGIKLNSRFSMHRFLTILFSTLDTRVMLSINIYIYVYICVYVYVFTKLEKKSTKIRKMVFQAVPNATQLHLSLHLSTSRNVKCRLFRPSWIPDNVYFPQGWRYYTILFLSFFPRSLVF